MIHFNRWDAGRCVLGTLAAIAPAIGLAAFGSTQLAQNVRVASIYKGQAGAIYVTFTPAILSGCNANYGGYLTSTWAEAQTGDPGPAAADQQLALLMFAKATDAPLEVRYRLNLSGTGWDKCAIDGIWVQ